MFCLIHYSDEIAVYGEKEQGAYNTHDGSTRNRPLLLFDSGGYCVAAKLRLGDVHSADGSKHLLQPGTERPQKLGKEASLRADAFFAKPEIYEALEERGVKYAIRISANDCLLRDIAELLVRPVGRPAHKPVLGYKGFSYRAASCTAARHVAAKVEFHAGELFPRLDFIMSNTELANRKIVRFYHQRRKTEQWIKEGKRAVRMTRLSCDRFRGREVRLRLSILAHNLGNS